MKEPGLITLRVKWSGRNARTRRHTHHHIGRLAPAPICLRKIITDLRDALRNKISELHFHHGLVPVNAQTQSCTEYRALAQWRIAYTLFPELFHKSFRDLEHSTVLRDILAHQHQVLVTIQ